MQEKGIIYRIFFGADGGCSSWIVPQIFMLLLQGFRTFQHVYSANPSRR